MGEAQSSSGYVSAQSALQSAYSGTSGYAQDLNVNYQIMVRRDCSRINVQIKKENIRAKSSSIL
jgi:hypothetical protein